MGKIEKVIYLIAAVAIILLALRFIMGILKIAIVLAGIGFVVFLIYNLLQDNDEAKNKAGNDDL
ncbi:hypothetical protein [Thermonema rossianum]|uniref:hypothetical protein n=1 Tax=Thermonema rossianum TaxID=55505 RepID=UPI00056FA8F0|nr:hypothetical protein [Thermonema rossianum]